MKHQRGDVEIWLVATVVAIIVVIFVVISVKDDNRHRAQCTKNGGHVVSKTHWHTTYSGGHSHLTSDTDHYCLNPSGGILDIW